MPGPAGIEVDERIGLVVLPAGCHLDLGGIGKGRSADLVIDQLLGAGALGACVDLGGDVRVGGLTAGGGDDWVIAVDDPFEPGRDLALLRLAGGAVTTSSSAKRRWSTDSGGAHHLIDPTTGRSARSGTAAVTVVAGSAAWGEVHAKAALIAGAVRGRALIEEAGMCALLVADDGTVTTAGPIGDFLDRHVPHRGGPLVITATTVVLGATKIWWYVARSAGIVAWGLSALAVLWGLALSTRALGRKPPAPWLLDVHRFLGALTVLFVVVHLVGLGFDPWASFGVDELLIPMASSWKPVAVAWGIVALYLLIAIEGTSLLKSRLPLRLWRGVHLTSYAMYAMATVHLLLAGTDRYSPVLRVAVVVSVGAVVFFTMYRLIGPGRAASVKSGRRPTVPRSPRTPAGPGGPGPEASTSADIVGPTAR